MSDCSCSSNAAVTYNGALTTAGAILLKQALLNTGAYLGILSTTGAEVAYEGYARMHVEWTNVDSASVSRNINRLTPAMFPVTNPPTMYSSLGLFENATSGEPLLVINLMRNGAILNMPLDKAYGLSIKSGRLAVDFARAFSQNGTLTATGTCSAC